MATSPISNIDDHGGVVPGLATRWRAEGRDVAIATLVDTRGSSPMGPGASMVVDGEGAVEGSVSGGCVEGAVAQEAAGVIRDGAARLLSFGISDELAGSVGFTCGGEVEVLVRRLDHEGAEVLDAAGEAIAEREPVAVLLLLDGAGRGRSMAISEVGSVGDLGCGEQLNRAVAADALGLLAQGQSLVRRYGRDGTRIGEDLRVFVHSFGPGPRVIVCGAVDFSVAFARLARELGYRVTVCDPRRAFAASSRLRAVAEVVCEWPGAYIERQRLSARDAILLFTHDPKQDVPAAIAAVRTDVGYIGALGSRRTHLDRTARLGEAGLTEADIARISSPVGLDIGSSTPAETAISVLAEMTAIRRGRRGGRLFDADGPIRAGVEHALPRPPST